ncbi:SDR family oxidoreductase [Bdellovibrio bacteriovorus]|uniref:2,5-dichloro-2,5-cyclohexadiene-1,4-diol dehydrogenase n=1 Tax=Bdellovibrio bacteriovorus str. Tiberius TaxID=1069642 RepID=K7Z8K9_BDEBC|nr:SDR family oxidoreductase [Bdellovibrio bacteriovorus]AFY00784.1 2,5-dichloro-2,5-cyclohexadiene-1,4-diol dehydrogenase [Bdellovibrio bacteriovorus str. Tiberius]
MSKGTYRFSGKVAVVAGGSSGTGRATAIAFAQSGAHVVILDRDAVGGARTLEMIRRIDGLADFISCDVADFAMVKTAFSQIEMAFGRLDYAFNNTLIDGVWSSPTSCATEAFKDIINTNLYGVLHCMKSEIPLMLKNGGGAIVNCVSAMGPVGAVGMPAYVASKHAVMGLTKAVAAEFSGKGIRANCICPGSIDAPMLESLLTAPPVNRIERMEEIAECVLWLCSDSASFVSGHIMADDGGVVAL